MATNANWLYAHSASETCRFLEMNTQNNNVDDNNNSNNDNNTTSSVCVWGRLDRNDDVLDLHRLAIATRNNRNLNELVLNYGVFEAKIDSSKFGEALGSHPSLTRIVFYSCKVSQECIKSLVSAIVANKHQTQLRFLAFYWTCLNDDDVVASIARLLQANTPLNRIDMCGSSITSAGCDAILEAMDGNTHLRSMELRYNKISNISLTAVQALSRSNLSSLLLQPNQLTRESFQAWMTGLRNNDSLKDLQLSLMDGPQELIHLEELFTTFNYTLQTLTIEAADETPEIRATELLQRNEGVRNAHTHLQCTNYHVAQSFLWPQTLERISSKPSLLYHFVRHGCNVEALHDLLITTSSSATKNSGNLRERHSHPNSNNNNNNNAGSSTTS